MLVHELPISLPSSLSSSSLSGWPSQPLTASLEARLHLASLITTSPTPLSTAQVRVEMTDGVLVVEEVEAVAVVELVVVVAEQEEDGSRGSRSIGETWTHPPTP
jgi:hypothetical protein